MIEKFKKFARQNIASFGIVAVFLLVAYGIKIFNVMFSHDTEAIISSSESLYDSWISLGRYGLLIIKQIFGLYKFNPYLAAILMYITMVIASVVWEFSFYLITGESDRYKGISFIFPAMLFTAPVMAEQMSFLLQAFEIAFVILLTGIVMILIWQVIINKKYIYEIPAVIILALCFSCYQAAIPLYVASAIAGWLLFFKKQRDYFKSIFILLANMAVAYLLYMLGNRIAYMITDIMPASYLSDFIMWGVEDNATCIDNILQHVEETLLFKNIYSSSSFLIALSLAVVLIVIQIINKKKMVVLYALSMLVLFVTPFMMTIVMGDMPKYRTQIVTPFVAGFVIQTFLGEIYKYRNKVFKFLRSVLIGIVFILLIQQTNYTTRIFYSEYVAYEEDVRLAIKISDRIDKLNLGKNPKYPVVFVGASEPNLNPSAKKFENPGNSFFEWSYSTEYGTFIMDNFMKTLGYKYKLPTIEECKLAKENARFIPVWPNEGCVIVEDDLIIVKLS